MMSKLIHRKITGGSISKVAQLEQISVWREKIDFIDFTRMQWRNFMRSREIYEGWRSFNITRWMGGSDRTDGSGSVMAMVIAFNSKEIEVGNGNSMIIKIIMR